MYMEKNMCIASQLQKEEEKESQVRIKHRRHNIQNGKNMYTYTS